MVRKVLYTMDLECRHLSIKWDCGIINSLLTNWLPIYSHGTKALHVYGIMHYIYVVIQLFTLQEFEVALLLRENNTVYSL